ncbi:MAG: hypothetical protein V2A73_13595 [Pseudomonadota bacterium]
MEHAVPEEMKEQGWQGVDTTETLVRLVVGGGIRLSPQLAVIGELSTLADIEYYHSFNLAGQYDLGKLTIGGRLYLPFGDEMFDDIWGLGIDVLVRL